MPRTLAILVVLDIAALAAGIVLGITLEPAPAAVGRHFLVGLFVALYTCFIHCLVLFYLIGTGKDIRDALEEDPALASQYVPFTRRQKRRAFPAACFAIALMILAALMGGEVHSRLIALARAGTVPLRSVPFWWVHAACVAAAVIASLHAFRVELAVVRDNRRAIEAINRELAR